MPSKHKSLQLRMPSKETRDALKGLGSFCVEVTAAVLEVKAQQRAAAAAAAMEDDRRALCNGRAERMSVVIKGLMPSITPPKVQPYSRYTSRRGSKASTEKCRAVYLCLAAVSALRAGLWRAA